MSRPPEPDRRYYLTVKLAAHRMGCSERTIRRMIDRGEITGYRLGPRMIRVDLAEIQNLTHRNQETT